MPRDPAPPATDSRSALNAAIDALGGNLGAAFARPRGFGLPALPPGMGIAPTWSDRDVAASDHHPVEHPEPAFGASMKRHLDTVNRRLVVIAVDLDGIDAALASAIDLHLADVGLDNLNPTHNEQTQ